MPTLENLCGNGCASVRCIPESSEMGLHKYMGSPRIHEGQEGPLALL